MDREYFLGDGIPPPLHYEPSFPPSSMAPWQSLTSAPESNCFLHPNPSPNWEKSTEQYTHFESALSSMVSSPAASNSAVFSDGFAIRELIGKLGTICNAGEISPPPSSAAANSYRVEENLPNFRKSIPPNPVLSDPGFAERAAKFSCFGSRSFNCRKNQLGMNSTEFQYRSNTPLMGIGNLPRSPVGVQENKNSDQTQMEFSRLSVSASNSNEDSYISEPKSPNDLNSRKRKAVPRGKAKELAANATKEAEADDDMNAKRSKLTEISGKESGNVKKEEETKGAKTSPKPPEPPKDYIHVRARRGQATDSHSLAERVRREKISERMKLLQDLVPGCNKVTGKAPMLDEIINYVQSLQHQVEFLSMKLATVNPRLDFNMDSLLSKDIFQPNGTLAQPNYYGHQSHQTPQVHTNISSGAVSQSSVDPLDVTLCPNLGMQLPPVDGFGEGLPQFPSFCEDDLQSIIRMGFGENPNRDTALPLQTFAAPNQTSHTKIEL